LTLSLLNTLLKAKLVDTNIEKTDFTEKYRFLIKILSSLLLNGVRVSVFA